MQFPTFYNDAFVIPSLQVRDLRFGEVSVACVRWRKWPQSSLEDGYARPQVVVLGSSWRSAHLHY